MFSNYFVNGITLIFIFWRLWVLSAFIFDKESSKILKQLVGFSFAIFLASFFSTAGTPITVKEIWRYLLTVWLGAEIINGILIPIVEYLYKIIINAFIRVLNIMVKTDKLFETAKFWLVSLGILFLEILFLSTWLSFNYVGETDMIFDPRIKLIYNLAILSIFIYSVVVGVGGWLITLPEKMNKKYSKIKIITYSLITFSISGAGLIISLNRMIERNDGLGSLNARSKIKIMDVADFFNDFNKTSNLKEIVSSNEHIKEDIFKVFDKWTSMIFQADTLSEYYDILFTEGIMKKDDTFEILKEDLSNTIPSKKLTKYGAIDLCLYRYKEYYRKHEEFKDLFDYIYWQLREEKYELFEDTKLQSFLLIGFARWSYIFNYDNLANDLSEDLVNYHSNLIVRRPLLGLYGFVYMSESYNSMGKFHKAEKEITRGYYLFQQQSYNQNINDILELLAINEMTEKIHGILGASIAIQRPDSKYALQLLRTALEKDEGQNNELFSEFYFLDSYQMGFRKYYEVAMNYLGLFLDKYPEDANKVSTDVLSIIEKNKARSYKDVLQTEWIQSPPRMGKNKAGLNYITSTNTILGQYYDSDTTINFSLPISFKYDEGIEYDLSYTWVSMKENMAAFIDPLIEKKLLSDLLVPAKIVNRLSSKDLLISPDGILQEMPFQYLLNEIELSSITIIPAFSYLDDEYFDLKNLLAISVSNPNIVENQNSEISLYRDNILDSLGFATLEADNIFSLGIKYLDGTSKHQKNATESWVKENSSSYDIIHFSAHSIANDFITGESGIYLNKDHDNDGFLSGSEIKEIEFDGQFIFLSSCESASGYYQAGEGTMSIAKAFLDAGASGIIASLWKVNDESVTKLSELFYKNFLTGIPPEQALYMAQKEFTSIHPYTKYPFIYISF